MRTLMYAHELQRGDRIVAYRLPDGQGVDVADGVPHRWIVDGVIHRPEDAPSYRRHRHGHVQVLFDDARLDLPKMEFVLADRPEVTA